MGVTFIYEGTHGAQQLYEKENPSNPAVVIQTKEQLRNHQTSMRTFINECNAKSKNPSVKILNRKPNREWAGDMPKTQTPARTKHGAERMKERHITDQQAADAIIRPLHKDVITYDDRGRPEQKHIGAQATIILNPETQEIITAYPTKRRIRKRYGAE